VTDAPPRHDDASRASAGGLDLRYRKSDRLRKRREYLLVQQRGVRIHLPDLLVFVYPRSGQRRLGITASGKVGGAVVRNRIKRLLREIWRRERARLPEDQDLVLVAKRSAAQASHDELSRQLADLTRRLGRKERDGDGRAR